MRAASTASAAAATSSSLAPSSRPWVRVAQREVRPQTQCVQVDARRYRYTAIDDATRIRALKVYTRHTQKNAMHFLDHVIKKFPFRIHTVRTAVSSFFPCGTPMPALADAGMIEAVAGHRDTDGEAETLSRCSAHFAPFFSPPYFPRRVYDHPEEDSHGVIRHGQFLFQRAG